MVPNLDLVLLALLHGSLISCVLLVGICLLLACLLVASALLLFAFLAFDIHERLQSVTWLLDALRVNVELGAALVLCIVIGRAVGALLDLRPRLGVVVSEVKVWTFRRWDQLKNLSLVWRAQYLRIAAHQD